MTAGVLRTWMTVMVMAMPILVCLGLLILGTDMLLTTMRWRREDDDRRRRIKDLESHLPGRPTSNYTGVTTISFCPGCQRSHTADGNYLTPKEPQ